LDTDVDINRTWRTSRENSKISVNESLDYYELKKHKQRFDEGCSELLHQRKQAKLHLLWHPSEINDNLNKVKVKIFLLQVMEAHRVARG
jgi:hypothetical protein